LTFRRAPIVYRPFRVGDDDSAIVAGETALVPEQTISGSHICTSRL
jgi:hypothetical protein